MRRIILRSEKVAQNMKIWALILIIYLAGAFVLRDNFYQIFLQPGGAWWAALLAFGLIVTAFFGTVKNFMGFLSEDRHQMLYAFFALFCIGGIEYLNTENNILTNERTSEIAAMAIVHDEVTINRSWDGHFRAITQVNGTDVGLMVDTGASLVLLRHDDAIRIGLPLNELEYSTPLTTASGKSYVASVVIESLSIGNVTVYDVRAAVAQRGALHSSLLGMSFLENLRETVIRKDKMILRE